MIIKSSGEIIKSSGMISKIPGMKIMSSDEILLARQDNNMPDVIIMRPMG